jgi:hypothetical protein
MKLGIIGAGNVGGALAEALLRQGHQVMFGSREPGSDKMQALLSRLGPGASAGSIAEAVTFGEALAIATPWAAVGEAVTQGDWSGKVVMDATNRFGDHPRSAAEDLAALIPGARVVKAFNTIGAEHLLNPVVHGQKATMFICGDDPAAKALVGELVAQIGFDLVDAGPLEKARLLEKLAELWVSLMRGGAGRNIAFKLLRAD